MTDHRPVSHFTVLPEGFLQSAAHGTALRLLLAQIYPYLKSLARAEKAGLA